MTLSISMKTASADLTDSAITKAITMLATKIAKSSHALAMPKKPSLDVTFMLPGKLEKPAFTGMRMGGYEAQADTLFFEIAVPEHILHSAQSHVYAATALQDVIANANDFFAADVFLKDRELHFNVLSWQQFVNKILASTINGI